YKGSVLMAVPLASAGDTAGPRGKHSKGAPYGPSPTPAGEFLYFTELNGNLLTILDAKSGRAVLDKERVPGGKGLFSAPVFAAGRVYLTDRTGVTLVLKPGEAMTVLATNKLNDPVDASPVAVGKKLLLRGEKNLYCLEEVK